MLDTDVPFRRIVCRDCRAQFVTLYHRGDRLMCDILAPAITPGTGHTEPIEPIELLPAEGDLPEWRSQYFGLVREKEDPRGAWFFGIDVAEETEFDPRIEITCKCQGPHHVDLAAIAAAAAAWRRNLMPWPVT